MVDRGKSREAVSRHDRAIQLSNRTKLDRHPRIFSCARDVVAATGVQRPRVLSFGCSTGEEAFTLSSKYFPKSEIVGSDIDAASIARARHTYGDHPNLHFALANERPLEPLSFDVIFAMNVLCRWPATRKIEDISDLYPFDAFEQHVAYLDTLLKPGGIMVIHNANYSFLLAQVSHCYDLIATSQIVRPGRVKRFRRDGSACRGAVATDCIYWKHDEIEPNGAFYLTIRNRYLQPIARIARDLA